MKNKKQKIVKRLQSTQLFKTYQMLERAVFGPKWGRELLKQSHEQVQQPIRAVDSLGDLSVRPGFEFFDEPIFILSAGWRSGSTLLQRILLAEPDLMIWGEPYHRSNIIDSLLEQLIPLQSEWPPNEYYVSDRPEDLSEKWVANCWPKKESLKQAHLSYWKALFESPLSELSKTRWGLKEVRWGKRHVEYLRWLYPKAKFIYLYRNPFDAYASFYHYPRAAFLSWPNEPIMNAKQYASMWLSLVNDFEGLELEGCGVLVKYEELKSIDTKNRLEEYLEKEIAEPSKFKNISSPAGGDARVRTKNYLPVIEKLILRYCLKGKLEKYGYHCK